jgi:hypothetical protein
MNNVQTDAMKALYHEALLDAHHNYAGLDTCMAKKAKPSEQKPAERPPIVNSVFNEEVLYDLLYDLLCHHKECQVINCATCDRAYEIKVLLLVPFST